MTKNVRNTAVKAIAITALTLFLQSARVHANADANANANANEQPAAAGTSVTIDNFTFGPQTVTVPVGAAVTWNNRDDIPHTAVSTDGVFRSKVMDTNENFSYTFTKAGTYSYYCTIHPKMTGQILVK